MAPAVPGLSAYVPVTPVLWPCITWLVSSTCSALTWACVQHRYYDNSSPRNLWKNKQNGGKAHDHGSRSPQRCRISHDKRVCGGNSRH